MTRDGGLIVFSLKCDIKDSAGFTAKFDELEGGGRWELVRVTSPMHLHTAATETEPLFQIWAFRVLKE